MSTDVTVESGLGTIVHLAELKKEAMRVDPEYGPWFPNPKDPTKAVREVVTRGGHIFRLAASVEEVTAVNVSDTEEVESLIRTIMGDLPVTVFINHDYERPGDDGRIGIVTDETHASHRWDDSETWAASEISQTDAVEVAPMIVQRLKEYGIPCSGLSVVAVLSVS